MTNRPTADQIIAMLDRTIPLQAAHIQAVSNLQNRGERYSNERCDVLGAAWSVAVNGKTEISPWEAKWVEAMTTGVQ